MIDCGQDMETVVIDNKTYVKASQIAKQFRYTNDYIGQLCRARKVDCQLVGRTWFVTEASLLEHKDSRYKEVRANEISIKNNTRIDTDQELVYPRLQKKTLRKLSVTHDFDEPGRQQTRYYTDEEPLVPAIQRRIVPQIPLTAKDPVPEAVTIKPVQVKVKATEKPKQKLAFTEVPAVSLRGILTVSDADVTIDDVDADFAVVKPPVSHSVPVADESREFLHRVARAAHPSVVEHTVTNAAAAPEARSSWVVVVGAFLSALVLAGFFVVASLQMTIKDGFMTASAVGFTPENILTIWAKL